MKNKKGYWIVLLTIAALLLDLVGRVLADQFVLPLWCDCEQNNPISLLIFHLYPLSSSATRLWEWDLPFFRPLLRF